MGAEVFDSNKGGVDPQNAHKLNKESEKAKAYDALAKEKEGSDPDQRMDEAYQKEHEFLSEERLKDQGVFQGSIDKYDPKKDAFTKEGEVNKKDSLYLILVAFFRGCYKGNPNCNDLANKETLMALACLTEQKVNVDRIPAYGIFNIKKGALSIATKTAGPGEIDWDVCKEVPLIKDSPAAVRIKMPN